jgi:hypothetical protein
LRFSDPKNLRPDHPSHEDALQKESKKDIVIIDREQRNISSEDFENSIRNELISRNIACDDLIITSPDRNFESWIVPFLNESCEPCLEGQAIAEGNNGKSIIKRKFKAIGRTYVETVDGVKLFKMINPTALAGLSDSFRRFTQVFEEECWWFKGAN